MALLRCCLLWLLLPVGCGTQKLPTRDEELFQMQIRDKAFFHDSSVIPDGAEISSYLFRDTLKRYFFVVEEDNTPLSVTVTPCDVPLEWKLSLQELPEETSGEGSDTANKPPQTTSQKAWVPYGWTMSPAPERKPVSSTVPGSPGGGMTVAIARTLESPATLAARDTDFLWVFLSDWCMEKTRRRDAWRFLSMASGEPSATMDGVTRTQLWSVGSLALRAPPEHEAWLTLGKEQDPSTWTT
ncbi:uncharacterized protein LOC123629842 [Lemur catta]|uniref:uncharacterized protein LOC123629842 n=1 Tax=Lemur catta TaxID=9447 RepID=UPI001E267E1A|nr:uncharacterized protein LOC123629842 [Lemur catta]